MDPQTRTIGPSLPMLAVLDRDGSIVWVNEAWQLFGRANGVPADYQFINKNYLAITRQADHDKASYIASEIGDVLCEDRQLFTAVYPCQADGHDHRFQVYATGATIAGERHGLVLNRQITGRTGDGSSAETGDWQTTESPHRAANRLVTYTISPDETATGALLAAFEAVGVDPMQRETTLQSVVAADAVDRLAREGGEFHLTFHVWEHPVTLTQDAVTIYATDAE